MQMEYSNRIDHHFIYIREESLEIEHTVSSACLVILVPFSSVAEFFMLFIIQFALYFINCLLCFIMIDYVIGSKVSELKFVYIMAK